MTSDQERIKELEKQLVEMEKSRDAWKQEFDMYRSAWVRELGGLLIPKTHDIDALVLTTRDLYQNYSKIKEIIKGSRI